MAQIDIDRDAAHDAAQGELAKAIYPKPSLGDQIMSWIEDLLYRAVTHGAELPGGNGLAFDWRLLAGRKYWTRPWMLAGGLTPENVTEAVRLTGARQVDVSSGVESAPGVKDAGRIAAFAAALR